MVVSKKYTILAMYIGLFRQQIKKLLIRALSLFNPLFSRAETPVKFNKIYVLLLRPLGYGDIIMLSPVFIALRKIYQESEIFILTDYDQFFLLNNVYWVKPSSQFKFEKDSLTIAPTFSLRNIPFLFKAKNYLGYFLSNRSVSNFISKSTSYCFSQSHYYARAHALVLLLMQNKTVNVFIDYPKLNFNLKNEFNVNKPYLCIAPFASWPEKQYPLVKFGLIISELAKKNRVVIIGVATDFELNSLGPIPQSVINYVNRTSFSSAASLISKSSLFIGNDSGSSHVAYISRVPSIVLFGSVRPETIIPDDSSIKNTVKVLSTSHICTKFPCYNGFSKPYCVNDVKYACIAMIDHQQVIELSYESLGQ